MKAIFSKALSDRKIKGIEKKVVAAANDGKEDVVQKKLEPLLEALEKQEEAAKSLIRVINGQHLSIEQGLEILSRIYQEYTDNIVIVAAIGWAMESVRDIDQLNLSPPEHPLFERVVEALVKGLEEAVEQDEEVMILEGLAVASRMVARQYDAVAENCYRRLIEIDPEQASFHYGFGLFCKTRGLFKEGMIANQKALALVDEPLESYQWNLGICATGAGEPEVALEVWLQLGNKIEMGQFNLPDGGYPQCKVRLAQRPLAERDAKTDEPGVEETIWIERLSPCHGIIRSVLYQDLGVDYGDVVLIDGAPITYHTYGEQQVPVFPHLATLIRNDYQFFDFVAFQDEAGKIGDISMVLEKDAVVYVHSESYQVLCATCWRDPNLNHQEHKAEEKHVVKGRVAAPRDITPGDLLRQIDQAIADLPHCEIFIPQLCQQAGFEERSEVEQQRFDLLAGS